MNTRATAASWFVVALTLPLGLAVAQRPAWIPRDTPDFVTRLDHEFGWFDPVIGRPMAVGADFSAASAGPVLEMAGRSWIHRLSVTPLVAPRGAAQFGIGNHKVAYAPDRRVAVLVVAGTTPVTWEWDGVDWRTVATPHSLPPSGCISSLSWNGRPGAAEILATTAGQVWGYDGTDWRYRGGLPFDPNFGVYVPTQNLHVFGVRSGNWSGSMTAWDGAFTWPVTPSTNAAIPPDGYGAGQRVVFDEGAGRLVMVGFVVFPNPGPASFSGVLSRQGNSVLLTSLTQLANGPTRGFAGAPSMIYDSQRAKIVHFGGHQNPTVLELPSGGNTWSVRQRIDAQPMPTGLTGVDLAYDRQRQQSVMFGGASAASEFTAETWTFDGAHWQSHGVDPNVLGRNGASLAYVGSIGRTLMFGGNTESAGPVDELWSWTGSQWATIGNGLPRPAARFGHDMVWHEARNRVVLFGGLDGVSLRNDTWEYDPIGQSWQQIAAAVSPQPRNFAKLVYDSQRQRVILFGGATATAALDDTWAYSTPAGGWTQLAAPVRPQGRWAHAMEYDPQRNRVVLLGGWGYVPCGGSVCPGLLDDHWEFDSTTWVQRPSGGPSAPHILSTPLPPSRAGAGMTFDRRRQRLVLYGGTDGANPRADTWDFESGTDTFSSGQASGGVALRSLRPALAGGDLALEFENPSSFGWMAVHFETVPSPTHFVDPPIACGSRAWFYGLQPIVANVGGNPGVLQFQLPTWLLGVGLEFQAIALDAPGLCLRVSDPLAMTVQAP